MRLITCCPILVLVLAACGERAAPPATTATPPAAPAAVETTPAPVSPASRPAPAAPVDERFSEAREGWRADFTLRLPALPQHAAKGLHRACTAWLFQGLATPRATMAESGEAALAALIGDGARPTSAPDPWYCERAVVATHYGRGWLALRRSETSFAGGAHPNSRVEALIVDSEAVRALTLDEVVPPDRQAELRLILARELRRIRGLPADGPLTSEVASDADLPIPLPLLTDEGARFVWNPYEIGPYSDGAFEVAVPLAQMRGFLINDPW